MASLDSSRAAEVHGAIWLAVKLSLASLVKKTILLREQTLIFFEWSSKALNYKSRGPISDLDWTTAGT